MKNNKQNILIWFSKDGYSFFVEGAKSILTFAFTQDFIRYADIFDQNRFLDQLNKFLVQNKIENVNASFIVDQSVAVENYFVKNNEKVVQDFLDNIPYEEVISKVSERGDSMYAVGFNGSFFSLLASTLDKHGGTIEIVLPYIVLPETKLTLENAETILKKSYTLKNESFITTNANNTQLTNSTTIDNSEKHKEKSTLPYLIPIFVILIGVLVYLIVTTYL